MSSLLNDIKLRLKFSKHTDDQLDEMLYAYVADEVDQMAISKGLWAKAFAVSGGDENKTRAEYYKLRVASLRRELEILDITNKNQQQSVSKKADRIKEPEFLPPEMSQNGFAVQRFDDGHFVLYTPKGESLFCSDYEHLRSRFYESKSSQ